MSTPILQHYHNVLLPIIFALDIKKRQNLSEAITEVDYLVETLSHCNLNPKELEETELAYWAWWEKIRSTIN